MDEEPSVKIISQDKVDALDITKPKKPTVREQQFIDYFIESGNATQAALASFNCSNKRSANALGSKLIRRFGLEKYKKQKETCAPKSVEREDTKEGYLQSLEKAYKDKKITFAEMYNDIYMIAKNHKDATVRIKAYDWMYERRKEYDQEIVAREMEEKDIVSLLSEGLSSVDREVYIKVLKETRKIRMSRIKKRNIKIDPWKIIHEERNKEKDTSNIINLQNESRDNDNK